MGRFEDLVEQARTGDLEALDALETEFSGSTLRERAEKADSLEKELQSVRPLQRKARFEELAGKLDESLRNAIDVADVDTVEPNELTLEYLQDLATNKVERIQASKLAAAQDAGFESVEEYETALETVKNQNRQRTEGMEKIASGVSSSGGEAGGSEEPTRFEVGKQAFDDVKKAGGTDDVALAGSIDAILASQFTGEEA